MLSGPILLLCEQGYPEARFNHVPLEKFWLGFLSSRTLTVKSAIFRHKPTHISQLWVSG